ncbi:MAG: WbqC family protein [Bacteroidales bacterium]|nr:WbqC family protein [Bacteroidales bacterium]
MVQLTQTAILSTAYLPNVRYISKLLLHKQSVIDIYETYQKQSYRNRCTIYGANGPQQLTIPVIKTNGNHTLCKDILIEYETNWQHVHWMAIVSAYGHSPFFEIFEDELAHLFEKKEKFLIDFNLKILRQIQESMGTDFNIGFSQHFIMPADESYDFRNSIHPKERLNKPDKYFKPVNYFQVFSEKFGHQPNLSFIDLMFNEGPQAIDICRQMCWL